MKRLICLFIMLMVMSGCASSAKREEITKLKVKEELSKLREEIDTLKKASQILSDICLEIREKNANRVQVQFSADEKAPEYLSGLRCPTIEEVIVWKEMEARKVEGMIK